MQQLRHARLRAAFIFKLMKGVVRCALLRSAAEWADHVMHDMPRDGDTMRHIQYKHTKSASISMKQPVVLQGNQQCAHLCKWIQQEEACLSQPKAENGWAKVVLCDTNSEKGGRSLARALVRT